MRTVEDNWQRLFAGLVDVNNVVVEVGWFDEDAARIAYINDRGSSDGKHPPPRPVLAPGLDASREAATAALASGVRYVLRGTSGASAARAAGQAAGAIVEQAVRDAIDAVQPPNADSTIGQKHGYSAPLRGVSPDRIWNKLEARVIEARDADDEPGYEDVG